MTSLLKSPLHDRAVEDLSGGVFGRWTVLRPEKVVQGVRRRTGWTCRCACGTERWIEAKTLKKGTSQSCGCAKVTHGLTTKTGKHPIYIAWVGMWSRCTNVNEVQWKDYGGRGIKVCERWKDPTLFIADMMPTWSKGLMLDRKDSNGNYCPENCRWATRKEQNVNRRNVVIVDTPDGPLALKDATLKFGAVRYTTVLYRVHHKWDPWMAIITPQNQKEPHGYQPTNQ